MTEDSEYDPFARGRFPVGVRTVEARDEARERVYPCEIWYPAGEEFAGQDLAPETQDAFGVAPGGATRRQAAVRDAGARPGDYPLVAYSHSSGPGARRMATYLCTHLASHGYVVGALDHAETIAAELARQEGETAEARSARVDGWIANRVPDVRFLVDFLIGGVAWKEGVRVDSTAVGAVGHSFGGWTVLAAVEEEARIAAVVALAPGGSSRPRPGIIPAQLKFEWGRDVPTLYLVGENDTPTPLAGVRELFERTPATRRMVVLRRADHCHFMDDAEQMHEVMRTMPWPAELAYMPKEMLPIGELCSGEEAHRFTRGLTLAHLDATLRGMEAGRRFLAGDVEGELRRRGVEGWVVRA